MLVCENFYMKKIREESWAKNARLAKDGKEGLYFVKDSVTILGSGKTAEAAIKDAYNGLFQKNQK